MKYIISILLALFVVACNNQHNIPIKAKAINTLNEEDSIINVVLDTLNQPLDRTKFDKAKCIVFIYDSLTKIPSEAKYGFNPKAKIRYSYFKHLSDTENTSLYNLIDSIHPRKLNFSELRANHKYTLEFVSTRIDTTRLRFTIFFSRPFILNDTSKSIVFVRYDGDGEFLFLLYKINGTWKVIECITLEWF